LTYIFLTELYKSYDKLKNTQGDGFIFHL